MSRRFDVSQKSLSASLLKSWLEELAGKVRPEFDGLNNMSICLRHVAAVEEQFDFLNEKIERMELRARLEEERIKVTAQAKKRAKELGVDPRTVPGTGKDGAVLKSDVEKAMGLISDAPEDEAG